MKRSLFIIAAVFLSSVFLTGGKPREPSYFFHKGTGLQKQMLAGEKVVFPSLVLKDGGKSFTFRVGAEVWHESADKRYVYVKYPDRRFAAFLTDGIDVIDVEKKERYNIAHNIVYCLRMIDDRTIVAVRRHAAQYPDERYDERILTLSVIDVSNSPFTRTEEVLTVDDQLPDWNRMFTDEDEARAKKSIYVEGNALFYQDAAGHRKKYILSKHAD